jgi:flagellar basal-body rod modification protein FlgD
MSTTNSVTQVNNALDNALNGSSSSSSASAGAASSLTMSDILTLMTTQLTNQDPTQPMDSTQFVSQLAQFAQVSGIQSMQSSLATLTSSMLSSQALSGASLVGTSVLTSATAANLSAAGGSLSGAVTVPAGASNVVVQVVDASGATVDQISVSSQQGQNGFTWNGETSSGANAPAGTYTFQAVANVGSASQAPAVSMIGTVESVSINQTTNTLTLNTPQLGAVPFSSVQSIN